MKVSTTQRLSGLRQLLSKENLHAYFVPAADAHQSEYIAECDARRGFISGFTGSAGFAVVTRDSAALWTDGRYFLQASQQLDDNWTLMKQGLTETATMEQYLRDNVPGGGAGRIGIDPALVTVDKLSQMRSQLDGHGEVVSVAQNLVDAVWPDRPARPSNAVSVLPLKYTGKSHTEKISDLRKFIREYKPGSTAGAAKQDNVNKPAFTAAGYAVNGLDEIAWLLNLRGSDIVYNPVFFAYVLVTETACNLYTDSARLGQDVMEHLKEASVAVRPYAAFFADLNAGTVLGMHNDGADKSARKLLVSGTCTVAIQDAVGGASHIEVVKTSPIVLAKAVKNSVELEGFRQCHLRDAAALCEYFGWLELELLVNKNMAISEVDGADKLEEFRAQQSDFVGPSFDTISSVGANAAIIHYKPRADSCATIDRSQVYLCDSGGQYRDGTTDVTRTLHFGVPSSLEQELYTRVLKGHIAIDTVVFPTGTSGFVLDVLARTSLWQAGLDYRHGTGHGVGAFLNVHEGPHGIGARISYNDHPLVPGMTVTNEPGYYHDHHCGFRIENIMLVREAVTAHRFGDKPYLCFENVTFVPMCRNLLQLELLTTAEREWIDTYHKQCWEKVSPRLTEGGVGWRWLKKETAPLVEQL